MNSKLPAVLYSSANGVARIRFNRAEQFNALDRETAEAFETAVETLARDRSARVVVISAEGRAFGVGGHLGHFREAAYRRAAAAELIDPLHRALKNLAALPVVSVGSLQGAVAGGAMSLALNLDLLVAADDVVFNLAYARIGAPPDCGGTWALPRLVGIRRALEIALLSEPIPAGEALHLGLVNRVVSRAELEAETEKLALRLAAGPPIAQARIKALLRTSLDSSYAGQLDAEAHAFGDCASSRDFGSAVEAFLAKKNPTFNGT